MKKITMIAVIAALTLAAQAFAMGSGMKGGQSMRSSMSPTSMKTGSMMTTRTPSMSAPAQMRGAGAMTATMSAAGMTQTQMMPGSQLQPASVK